MSASQDFIDTRLGQLQAKIDGLEIGTQFELRELFSLEDWNADVVALNLARSVTRCFKMRTHGWPTATEPRIHRVQVGGIRQNGRERMFQRINGDHTP